VTVDEQQIHTIEGRTRKFLGCEPTQVAPTPADAPLSCGWVHKDHRLGRTASVFDHDMGQVDAGRLQLFPLPKPGPVVGDQTGVGGLHAESGKSDGRRRRRPSSPVMDHGVFPFGVPER